MNIWLTLMWMQGDKVNVSHNLLDVISALNLLQAELVPSRSNPQIRYRNNTVVITVNLTCCFLRTLLSPLRTIVFWGLVLLFGTSYNLREFRPSCRIWGAAQAVSKNHFSCSMTNLRGIMYPLNLPKIEVLSPSSISNLEEEKKSVHCERIFFSFAT